MHRNLFAAITLIVATVGQSDATELTSERVPASFENDRVWVTPSVGGRTLRFYTDTGGGWNAISERAVQESALHDTIEQIQVDGRDARLIPFPAFDPDRSIPKPPPYFMDGRLMIGPDTHMMGSDGFLGGRWFADGIWDFDYPRRTLHRLASFAAAQDDPARVPLGFQVDDAGNRTMHFPSMSITVDGEVLDVLLDTGATATLTETSGPVFGLPAGTGVGTSFIEQDVFERWTRAHPDWRVVEQADQLRTAQRMIEVPQVQIAGQRVGPVWFAERPNGAFGKYMASMMDRPTHGAIGGSALRYFRVVIDYPSAAAYFYRTGDAAQ